MWMLNTDRPGTYVAKNRSTRMFKNSPMCARKKYTEFYETDWPRRIPQIGIYQNMPPGYIKINLHTWLHPLL